MRTRGVRRGRAKTGVGVFARERGTNLRADTGESRPTPCDHGFTALSRHAVLRGWWPPTTAAGAGLTGGPTTTRTGCRKAVKSTLAGWSTGALVMPRSAARHRRPASRVAVRADNRRPAARGRRPGRWPACRPSGPGARRPHRRHDPRGPLARYTQGPARLPRAGDAYARRTACPDVHRRCRCDLYWRGTRRGLVLEAPWHTGEIRAQ